MTKTAQRSLRHFYPGSSLSFFLGLVFLVAFSCFEETLIITRCLICYLFIVKTQKIYLKAWRNNRPTHESLLDALLVPYKKKEHNRIQFLLLSLFFFGVLMIHTITYAFVSKYSGNECLMLTLNTCILGSIVFFSTILSHHVSYQPFKTGLIFFSVFYTAILSIALPESLDSLLNETFTAAAALMIPVIYLTDKWDRRKAVPDLTVPAISNNLKGILTLSKMPIIKDTQINEAFGLGISGYAIYRLGRTVLRSISSVSEQVQTSGISWNALFWMLVLITLISSIHSIKTIYISKSMLRIVPVKKNQLFTASVFKALRLPVLVQCLCCILLYLIKDVYPITSFFKASHPYEVLVNGLYLAIIPSAVYLICFCVYASENRFTSFFLWIILAILTGTCFAISSLLILDTLPGRIIILIMLILIPHLSAFYLYRKMQNIHSY